MKSLLSLTSLLTLASCAPGLRDHVASAADKRDIVCGLAANTLPGDPSLEKVRELCAADAGLQEIARAYGGCAK